MLITAPSKLREQSSVPGTGNISLLNRNLSKHKSWQHKGTAANEVVDLGQDTGDVVQTLMNYSVMAGFSSVCVNLKYVAYYCLHFGIYILYCRYYIT